MKESRQLEVKEKINSYKDLNKELVAFLNDIGGEVLIGINDEGTIIGLNESDIEKYMEEIPSSIFNSISPYCHPELSIKNLEGKQLISIKVTPSSKRPYFIKAKGIPEGVYVRIGTHAMPTTAEIIEDLQRSNVQESYDTKIIINTSIDEFDNFVLKDHYAGITSQEKLIADKVIAYDQLKQNFFPTLSGVLFFHKDPSKIIEGAEVLYTKFASEDMSQIVKTKDYKGPLVSLVNEVLNDLKMELVTLLEKNQSQLIASQFLISPIALRELIINALIHRKYYINDAIKIALFSNRIEVYSPGNFPGPITDYQAGISYSRNPNLRQLARNIGLVEKRGLGLPLIFSECKKNNNPEPQFIDQNGDFVKVIIYFPTKHLTSEKSQDYYLDETELALQKLKEKSKFTLQDIADAIGCSKNTASSRIKPFLNKKIKQVGKGRATHFIWLNM